MKYVSHALDAFLDDLDRERDSGAPWLGDPWCFDVRCLNCDHAYPSSHPFCLACDSEEARPVGFAGPEFEVPMPHTDTSVDGEVEGVAGGSAASNPFPRD